jgi:hypothetical protein
VFISPSGLPRQYREAGVFELSTVERYKIERELDIKGKVPTARDLDKKAKAIARIVRRTGASAALLEVPHLLCSRVESELRAIGIAPMYALSEIQRYAVETPLPEVPIYGETMTKTRFVLLGMVEV